MLIARLLISLFLALVVFSAGVLYTFNQTKVYEAEGALQLLDPETRIDMAMLLEPGAEAESGQAEPGEGPDAGIRAEESIQTELAIFESRAILRAVEQRLQGEERARFMAPYLNSSSYPGPPTPVELLESDRRIFRMGDSRLIRAVFRHPDPVIAARIANLLMDEYINYGLTVEIDAYMRATEDLALQIERVDEEIAGRSEKIAALRESAPSADVGETSKLEIHKQALESAIAFRSKLASGKREAIHRVTTANPQARVVDPAEPPFHHASPNYIMHLGGVLLIALLGALVVFILTGWMSKN